MIISNKNVVSASANKSRKKSLAINKSLHSFLLHGLAVKMMTSIVAIFALTLTAQAQEKVQTMYNDISVSELSVLKSSRSQVIIYELVNIKFNADMVDSRDYLKGFTSLSSASQQRLSGQNSFQRLLSTNSLVKRQDFAMPSVQDTLMLSNDQIAALHNRVINISASFVEHQDSNLVLASIK